MINKIKAEIKNMSAIRTQVGMGEYNAYNKCLKWAKELKENLYKKVIEMSPRMVDDGDYDEWNNVLMEFNEIIEKAFREELL